MIEIVTFGWVPTFVQGVGRDLRVRWALEEAGLAYDVRYISFAERDAADYRALQPFGQIPAYREDGIELFESGAIVLHIAEKSEALMPTSREGIASTRAWIFAALNSIEPAIQFTREIEYFAAYNKVGKAIRKPLGEKIRLRLTALGTALGDRDYLCGSFTAADVMMASVLRMVKRKGLSEDHPALADYVARCEARPAFRKALADHMAPFAEHA